MAVTKNSAATQALIDQAVKDATASATQGLVPATSKPDQIQNLTKTWRKSTEHLLEQVKRFVVLTILSAIPSVINLISGGKFDWRTLLAFITPFAAVALRQVVPSMSAASVDSAQGATIVPDQVGAQTVDVPVDASATVQVAVDPAAGPVVPTGDAAP